MSFAESMYKVAIAERDYERQICDILRADLETLRQQRDTYKAERDAALREVEEQARILGMGSEREARLMAERVEAQYQSERHYANGVEMSQRYIAARREADALQQQVEALTGDLAAWRESARQAESNWNYWRDKATLTGKEAG